MVSLRKRRLELRQPPRKPVARLAGVADRVADDDAVDGVVDFAGDARRDETGALGIAALFDRTRDPHQKPPASRSGNGAGGTSMRSTPAVDSMRISTCAGWPSRAYDFAATS